MLAKRSLARSLVAAFIVMCACRAAAGRSYARHGYGFCLGYYAAAGPLLISARHRLIHRRYIVRHRR